ncbi:MAG: MarR family transcriptional regulator, partial [Acidobacteriota bacterium]
MPPNQGSASSRILNVLKRSGGGLSVKAMCQKLDLSSMAVRRQLAVLEAQDLVLSQREKQKTGRPSQVYDLTDEGHEEFDRDYCTLTIDLLVGVRSLLGKPKINQLLGIRNSSLLEEAERRIRGKTLETRVHEVAQLLTEGGYMADWE